LWLGCSVDERLQNKKQAQFSHIITHAYFQSIETSERVAITLGIYFD
jgi:hypothetical protein